MKNNYFSSYNELAFSESEKCAIKANLSELACEELLEKDGQNMSQETNRISSSPAPRKKYFAIAAALLLALVLGSGGIAYATGNWNNVIRFMSGIFNGSTASTEIVEHIGRPIEASATDAGITITAESIIGDKNSFAVVYSLVKDDGSAFETSEIIEGDGISYLPYSMEPPVSQAVGGFLFDGFSGSTGECYFYDEDPTDNAIQYVEKRNMYSDGGTASVIGKEFVTNFNELIYWGDEGSAPTIVEGNWEIHFVVDYDDLSVEVPTNSEKFALLEGEATMQEMIVSPLSLSLRYVADEPGNFKDEPSGRMSDENSSELNRLLDLNNIVFTMKDGTEMVQHNLGGGSVADDGVSCQKVFFLDTLMDVDELESITIGGTTFTLA